MTAARSRLLLALAVGAFIAPAVSTRPVAAALPTPTIAVALHTENHATASVFEIGTLAHLEVVVRHDGQPVSGQVSLVFYDAAGCGGLSYTGDPVSLENGEADGPRPYGYSEPNRGSFRARYLGSQTMAPVTSECLDATWKARLAQFDSAVHANDHTVSPTVIAVGVSTHLWSRLAGDYGPIEGTWRSYVFTNGSCSGSGTERYELWGADLGEVHGYSLGGIGSHAFQSPGTYSWQAHFAAGPVYLTKTGVCQPLTVKAQPTVAVAFVDANGQPISQLHAGSQFRVRGTASGSFGTPTGSSTLYVHEQPGCQGGATAHHVDLSGGAAQTALLPAETPGGISARFRYRGSDTYFEAVTACVDLTVLAAPASAGPSTQPTTRPTSQPTTAPSAGATAPASGATAPSHAAGSQAPGSPTTVPGAPTAEPDNTGPSIDPAATGVLPGASGEPITSDEPASPGASSGPEGIGPAGSAPGPDPLVAILAAVLLALLLGLGATLLIARRRSPKGGRAAGEG